MNTPICDFAERYAASSALRLHMPGHKGISLTGMEKTDITEINGADDLFHSSGIIAESEKNASCLFGTAASFYSTEGSSLCIRAMLLMAMQHAGKRGRKAKIIAGRNAHKAFITAAALLDFEYLWIMDQSDSYLACRIDETALEDMIACEKPDAVYITSPDYLGNTADIASIARLCRKYGCLLLVDNAHGAYLKFLPESMHPMDLGADICCDSAHKTLPALTGAAYLHISKNAPASLISLAKSAMALFASSSPSYLIMQSLDKLNKYIADVFSAKLSAFLPEAAQLKAKIQALGFDIAGDEAMKISVVPKAYGYTGEELAEMLEENGIICEFADKDYVVLMLSCEFTDADMRRIAEAFASIPKKAPLCDMPPRMLLPERAMNARDVLFEKHIFVDAAKSLGCVFAANNIACPPAVPIVVSGEIIDQQAIRMFEYYGVERCEVIENN